MAFALLTYRESLRDIETCLRAHQTKLYHLGIHSHVAMSTLADANKRRDWRIYTDFAICLIQTARKLYADDCFAVELAKTAYALYILFILNNISAAIEGFDFDAALEVLHSIEPTTNQGGNLKLIHACSAVILCIGAIHTTWAQNKVLLGDARMRPPEMLVDEKAGTASGPLIEVFNEAAAKLGYTVQWRPVPFARSIDQMKTGTTDIVPRLIMTEERKNFAEFLGPIGVQHAEIEFLVRSGKESSLKSYSDLQGQLIGVKRKTVYFEQFDKDKTLRRAEAVDDEQLAAMFNAKRFDVIIVLDKPAIKRVFKEKGIADYAWAPYKVPIALGVYFGMAKTSKHAATADVFSSTLKDMLKSGRVAAIYKNHNVTPPPEK